MAKDEKREKYDFIGGTEFDREKDECENISDDARCGAACFHPEWIQKFASKKICSLALGVFGLAVFGQISSYQGTMSTMEKNFGLSAKAMGSLKSVNRIAGIVGNFFTYAADRGNKMRWISFASLIFSLGCICFIMPIFSSTSLQNINAYRKSNSFDRFSDNISHITSHNVENSCNNESNKFSFFENLIILPIVVSQCLIGFAYAIQRACGYAYMDNNIRKNVLPIWFAGIYSTQWVGYGMGLVLTSFALKLYVFPTLPVEIDNSDPRWIGAWWVSSVVFGGIALLLTPIFFLYPKSLPRAAEREQNKNKNVNREISWNDFCKSLRAILSNKILMCQTASSVMFSLGFFATFWPKYIEIQYGMTASKSSLIQGITEFVGRPVGMFTSSILIMKLKPGPKTLLRSNLIITFLCFVICVLLAFMDCGSKQITHGHMNQANNWDLTEKCNAHFDCSKNTKFAPVCDKSHIFFSSCYAGCNSAFVKSNKTIFTNCDCMNNPTDFLEEGLCRVNCTSVFTIYVLLLGLMKTLKAGARSIKILIEFRSMDNSEKSFSIGIVETIQSLFSIIPATILYGFILDASCLVWDNKCGMKGNCWLYDTDKLRYTFFFTSSVFIGASVVMDAFLCVYIKSLKIYDEDFVEKIANIDENKDKLDEKLLTTNFIQ